MSKILHVLKLPVTRPALLAAVREYDEAYAPQLPDGWEVMTAEEYAAWSSAQIAAGWTPQLSAQADVPQSVTPWQMRRALNQLGLRAMVEAAVAAGDQDARDGWEFALEIRRDNPLLAGMAQALGMTDAQLDDLFRLAASFQ